MDDKDDGSQHRPVSFIERTIDEYLQLVASTSLPRLWSTGFSG
jgi:hypothetical protein